MQEEYMANESKDGYMPVCPTCHKPYGDAEIGDVKNYPADGVIAVFFTCDICKEEASFTYIPQMKNPDYYKIILKPAGFE